MKPKAVLIPVGGNKYGGMVYDGEILYLGQFLFDRGFDVRIIDGLRHAPKHSTQHMADYRPDVFIIHLGQSDLLTDESLKGIFLELDLLRNQVPAACTLAFGSVATALRNELLSHKTGIDAIAESGALHFRVGTTALSELDCLPTYFTTFPTITDDFLRASGLMYDPCGVGPLWTSRGCENHCAFCAYNNYVPQRATRQVNLAIHDAIVLHQRFRMTKFSLCDSNFGLNRRRNRERAEALAQEVYTLKFPFRLAMNISTDGLDEQILDSLRSAGVTTILVGLESLSESTLTSVFNKNQSVSHAVQMVLHAERTGVVPVVSYILFHPWLTWDQLKDDVERIAHFGRHRIVQFLCRSRLQVIPGTAIERKLAHDGLLLQRHVFMRDYEFVDKRVAHVLSCLRDFTEPRILACSSHRDYANLKLTEWKFLQELIFGSVGTRGSTNSCLNNN